MALNASFLPLMYGFALQNFSGMTAETTLVHRRRTVAVRYMAFITVQPCHRNIIGETGTRRFSVAGKAGFTVGNEFLLFLARKRMTRETGDLFSHTVNVPSFVTSFTCMLIRPEGMHGATVTIATDEFLHEDMPGMTDRFVYGDGALGYLVPMTLIARLPGCFGAMGLRRFTLRRKHELDQ